MENVKRKELPSEFDNYSNEKEIPWSNILGVAGEGMKDEKDSFEVITDSIIKFATKESMKDEPNQRVIAVGLHACLIRGRLSEALFMSSDSKDVEVLALRAIVLFALSDIQALKEVTETLDAQISDESEPSDRIRLSTVKVLLAAANKDTSVIMCVMEFDSLLETYPEQVESPLVETMFTLYVVGLVLREVGQISKAERIADTLEEMARSKSHRMFLALVENLRGHICNYRGEFDQSEKHYRAFKRISESLGFRLGIAMSMNNLGTLKLNSLSLEESLDFFEQSFEMMEMESGRIIALANLGEISTVLGRYSEAESYLLKGMKLEEKIGSGIIELYTWYSILLARTNQLKESQKYLKRAEIISKSSEKPMQRAAYLYARGVHEATKKNYAKAISTFEQLLDIAKKDNIFEFLIRAELQLATTYTEAYNETREDEKLSKAGYHLNDIIQIAKEQGIQALYAEALFARSDMFALVGQIWKAKGDIERALSVGKYIEDSRLITEARSRIETLESIDIVGGQTSVSKSLERIGGFKPATTSLRSIPQPDLHALITLERCSGMPVFVHHFGDQILLDSAMIGGFISAITSFSDELLGQSGLLRSIKHEGFAVMMEYTESWIVTLIADQESFDVRYKLRTFAQRFHETFPSDITKDGIQASEFEKTAIILEEVFSKVLQEERD